MKTKINDLLSKIEGVKRTGERQWQGHCPIHDDKHASLSISHNDNKILLFCHACGKGKTPEIMKALGLSGSNGSIEKGKSNITAVYDYRDETGKILFQQCRTGDKDFFSRKPDGTWGIKGIKRVLYRLPEVIRADEVFIVEGEKDADRLKSIRLTATTNPGGASKWLKSYNQHFKGKTVYILPDNDEPGRKHVELVANELRGVAKSVFVVELAGPDDPKGYDVSNWLDEGHTRDELIRLCKQESGGLNVICMADVAPEPIHWLWPDKFALGKLSIIIGDPEQGKSFLTLDMAARVSSGIYWPGCLGIENPVGSAIILSAEDDNADTIRPRLDAMRADCSKIYIIESVRTGNGERCFNLGQDMQQLESAAEQLCDCRLIVIDPISAYLGKVDGHSNTEVRGLLMPLSKLANRLKVAVVGINHLNKGISSNPIYRAMGSLAFAAAARSVWSVTTDEVDRDRRLLLSVKNNLAVNKTGLAYRLIDGAVQWEDEQLDMTANEYFNRQADATKAPRRSEAAEFLRELLADGPMDAVDVREKAKEQGYIWSTINRAKGAAGVQSIKHGVGKDGRWLWSLK